MSRATGRTWVADLMVRLGPMPHARVALAQIDTRVGDVAANAQAVLAWARKAADAGADLVVFPEMTLTGYPIEDLALRASFRRGAEAALQRDRRRRSPTTGSATSPCSSGPSASGRSHRCTSRARPRGRGDRPTRRSCCSTGRCRRATTSTTCPTTACSTSTGSSRRATTSCVIDVRGRRVGVVICEDIWQDGGPVSQMDEHEVSLLVVLNASPYEEGKGHQRVELAARRAHEVEAPVAYVNLVGAQDDLVFDGGSFVDRHRRHAC